MRTLSTLFWYHTNNFVHNSLLRSSSNIPMFTCSPCFRHWGNISLFSIFVSFLVYLFISNRSEPEKKKSSRGHKRKPWVSTDERQERGKNAASGCRQMLSLQAKGAVGLTIILVKGLRTGYSLFRYTDPRALWDDGCPHGLLAGRLAGSTLVSH